MTDNLFGASWLLVWSIAVVILGLVFLMMIMGREVIIVKPGSMLIRSDILCLGGGPEYDAAYIRNLRRFEPREKSSHGWRGQCLAFDYNGRRVTFGSSINGARAAEIMSRVEHALGVRIPTESGPHGLLPAWGQDVPADTAQHSFPETKPPELPLPATSTQVDFMSPSALILANLVPIVGVAFLHWDLGDVMLLFWTESAVIGFFNILKMAVIGKWGVLLAGPFFAGHYGAFMSFHLLFIYITFIRGVDDSSTIPLSQVRDQFFALWPAIAALCVSHGVSYFVNFLGRREYIGRSLEDQMTEPYRRIFVMHVTIIVGGFLAMALKSPLPALILLVALKIGVDLRAHLGERKSARIPA